jgi:glutamyl-tRNA synthetase
MNSVVRTRFAPSPTGYLHIGGVRTALFNWLFARKHGGQYILRIDDTDQQRNLDEALQPILDGFRWLGLDWDEGPQVGGPHAPYFQSQRGPRYQEIVNQLLASGAAYRDFARPEELQAEREQAEARQESFVYSRRWMAETPEDANRFEREGRQGVVRLKMPRQGNLVLADLIRGDVTFQWSREQDHVIQRVDGTCLYHLATVVDDHDFEISHVIRAEEHLSNTPRQVFIYQSLGFAMPEFAHIPFVAEPGSRTKLSKRKLEKYLKQAEFRSLYELGKGIATRLGLSVSAETFNPVIVDFYAKIGFLPDAIINYLVLLGWSLDDKTEEFTREEMIAHFSLERVNKGPASFDANKLISFQDRYMQRLPMKPKVASCVAVLKKSGLISDPPPCEIGSYVHDIVLAAGERIRYPASILDFEDFFTADSELPIDEKIYRKRVQDTPGAKEHLQLVREALEGAHDFSASGVEQTLRNQLESQGKQFSDVTHVLRLALTGKGVGFGLFDTLAILGKERSLRRIDRLLAWDPR